MKAGSPERVAAMVEMRQRAMTYQEIGSAFGVSRERVRQVLDQVGAAGRIVRCCQVEGCNEKRVRGGQCRSHLKRAQPESWLPGVPHQLANRVHPEPNTGCWLWSGGVNKVTGYGHISYRGRGWAPHRLMAILVAGGEKPPRNIHVHHRCEVRTCCNPDHLEFKSAADHAREHRLREAADGRGWHSRAVRERSRAGFYGPRRGSSSRYVGVTLRRGATRWQAQICTAGACRHLGVFDSEIDAALVYDAAAVEIHGERAWLNRDHFPEVAAAYEQRKAA